MKIPVQTIIAQRLKCAPFVVETYGRASLRGRTATIPSTMIARITICANEENEGMYHDDEKRTYHELNEK